MSYFYLVLYPQSFDFDFLDYFFSQYNFPKFDYSLIGKNPTHFILHLQEGD